MTASLASFLKVAEKLEVKGLVGEREELATTATQRPLPFPFFGEGATEVEQEVVQPKRRRGRPREAAKVVKAVRRGKSVPKAVNGDKDDEDNGKAAKVFLGMPRGISTMHPSHGGEEEEREQKGEVDVSEEGGVNVVNNNGGGKEDQEVPLPKRGGLRKVAKVMPEQLAREAVS